MARPGKATEETFSIRLGWDEFRPFLPPGVEWRAEPTRSRGYSSPPPIAFFEHWGRIPEPNS